MNFVVNYILIDGAELLLDLGCSPSLIGKCKIMIRIYKKETIAVLSLSSKNDFPVFRGKDYILLINCKKIS